MQLRKVLSAAVALAFAAAIVSPGGALACSICRCGDPTFNALGSNVYADGTFQFAIDWDRLSKEQGIFEGQRGGGEAHFILRQASPEIETIVEDRITATISYAFAQRFNVILRAPYSFKSLTEGEEVTDTHGFADPEILALARLWSSNFGPGLGRRAWLSALFGVKTPWGEDDLQQDGVRVDQHAQPGTGSTDLFGGLSFLYLFDEKSALFASAQYRGTGSNEFGYKYGNVALANLAYERKLLERLDAVLELNFRYAGEDTVDFEGVRDPNTGGSILFVTPRLLFDVTGHLVARIAVQIPTWKDLNGVQNEQAVYNAGLTYIF